MEITIQDIYPGYVKLKNYMIFKNQQSCVKLAKTNEELNEIFYYAEYYFIKIHMNYSRYSYKYLFYICILVANKYLSDYDESITLQEYNFFYNIDFKNLKNKIKYIKSFEINVLKCLNYEMNIK
jgi:hypothetical protein